MYLCKLWPRDRKTKTCDVVPVLIVGGETHKLWKACQIILWVCSLCLIGSWKNEPLDTQEFWIGSPKALVRGAVPLARQVLKEKPDDELD